MIILFSSTMVTSVNLYFKFTLKLCLTVQFLLSEEFTSDNRTTVVLV